MSLEGPMRRVAVVVASSRVGRATISALIEKFGANPGFLVRAVLRDGGKAAPEWNQPFIEIVANFNCTEPDSCRAAFEGVQRAFLVAPQREDRAEIVNKMMTRAKQCGVRHVVLVGGVFQEEERFVFHQQWMSSRRHAQQLGLAWTQLECSDFMENFLGSIPSIQSQGAVYGVDGASAPVALEDVGRAAAAVLLEQSGQSENRAYRVTGPQLLSPADLCSCASQVLGTHIRFVDVGLEEAERRATLAGSMARWQVEGFYSWMRLYFSTGQLRDVASDLASLGIEPTTFQHWLMLHRHLFFQQNGAS